MSFDWTPEELQKVVDENKIVIFMKGTPDQPQCGFSARGAQVISMVANELGMETFASVNVLSDPSCLLYTSPSPRDATLSRMPSSA